MMGDMVLTDCPSPELVPLSLAVMYKQGHQVSMVTEER